MEDVVGEGGCQHQQNSQDDLGENDEQPAPAKGLKDSIKYSGASEAPLLTEESTEGCPILLSVIMWFEEVLESFGVQWLSAINFSDKFVVRAEE